MTYKELIKQRLQSIAKITGDALSKEQAIAMGKNEYLEIEHNDAYGGYRVGYVKVNGGSVHGAFGGNGMEKRLNAKAMFQKLDTILIGMEIVISLQKPAN